MGNVGAKLNMNGVDWVMVACVFTNNIVLIAVVKGEVQSVVDEFYSICTSKKLKVNTRKNKLVGFERREVEVCDFSKPYRVFVPVVEKFEVV